MAKNEHIALELDGHEVRFSNPWKVFFPARGHTKLALCNYYLEVAEAVLGGLRNPPDDHEAVRQRGRRRLLLPESCPARGARLARALELAARDEREGLGDAPWPPHSPKQKKRASGVAPSRAGKN